jgi:hypothetical protein
MGYIESELVPGEELIYRITPARHPLRIGILIVVGILFELVSILIPVFFALFTQRFGRFPVIWGLPESLPVLVITVGLWLMPVLALFLFSLETAQIFACELAVTDRRILGRIPSLLIFKEFELSINEIALVSLAGGRVLFKLKNGKLIAVSGFQNAGQFVETCRMRMVIAISLITTTTIRAADEPTQRLKRLKDALDSGLITELEYTEKRNEILKQM